MNKNEFLTLLEKEFNLNSGGLHVESVLSEIPQWDSMSILVIMSLVDENFEITLTADDFLEIRTIGDLLAKIDNA